MNKRNIWIQVLVITGIILVANLISDQLYFRLDFTEDQRYTLSNATKEVLRDLDEVVTIKAYFSEDLPAQLLKTRQDVVDELIEYENVAGGNLVFEFVNPNESEDLERDAQQNGVSPVMINVTERDQVQQMRAYMGAVLKMDGRTEVIPVIQPGAAMEFALTTALKKVSIVDKPKLGMIEDYGATTIAEIPQLMEQLRVLYDVESISLRDSAQIPAYYRSLVWINPQDTIDSRDFQKIDTYLNQGGGLFMAYSPVSADLQTQQINGARNIGIRSWLMQKGLILGNNIVVDDQSATVNVQQRQGFFTINSQVEFPYFPRLTNFSEHAITNGLETVLLPFASNLTFSQADTTYKQLPLIFTSSATGLINPPAYIDIQKKWSAADFNSGAQIVAAALEGPRSRIALVANGTFCVNGAGERPQEQTPDNINLASNMIDWMADDTGLIDLRTKGITSRPLEAIEDQTKMLLKYGNVFAPILLLLIYAFIRKQFNNRKRQKWMQGIYD